MVQVKGRNLLELKLVMEKVGTGPAFDMRIAVAKMLCDLDTAIDGYSAAKRPAPEYEEYVRKMKGVMAKHGEKTDGGMVVPSSHIDAFQKDVGELKDAYAEVIEEEFERQGQEREIDESEWDFDTWAKGAILLSWVEKLNAKEIGLLLGTGLLDKEDVPQSMKE